MRPRTPLKRIAALALSIAATLLAATAQAQMLQSTAPASQPATLTISTRTIHSGEPVPGAELSVYSAGATRKITTGDTGEATVNAPAPEASQLSITISKPGWASMVWRWSRSPKEQSPPAHIDITMEKTADIGGYVVDDRGHPLAGATVLLVAAKTYGDRRQSLRNSYDPVTTDNDGKWTFNQAPALLDSVQIGASHPLCLGPYGFYSLSDFEDLKGLQQQQARVTLTRSPGILQLTVTDDAGKPLPGASVGYGADRVASNALADMTTNEDGKLTLGVPVPGSVVLTIKAKGRAPELWTGDAAAAPTPITVALKPAKALTGRVVDPAGKPVAGAAIFFDSWRGMRTLVDQVRTGPDGAFSWPSAPADTVIAAVQAPGLLRQDNVPLTAGQENLVTLKKSTLLKGQVLDAATGTPITQYRLVWGIAYPNQRVIWQRTQPSPKIKDDGSFETTFSGFYPAYIIKIEAPGYEPAFGDRVDALAGNTVEQVYRLKKGHNIEGTLLLPNGDPALGAKIYLATSTDELRLRGTQIPDSPNALSATTDGRGHFTFDPQSTPFGLFVTSDDGYAAISSADLAKNGGKIALTPWARVEGVVKQNGTPVPNANLLAQYQKAAPLSVDGGPPITLFIPVQADASGKYVIEHAFAGAIQTSLRIEQPQGGRAVIVGQGDKSAEVPLKPGQTAQVDVGQ